MHKGAEEIWFGFISVYNHPLMITDYNIINKVN